MSLLDTIGQEVVGEVTGPFEQAIYTLVGELAAIIILLAFILWQVWK